MGRGHGTQFAIVSPTMIITTRIDHVTCHREFDPGQSAEPWLIANYVKVDSEVVRAVGRKMRGEGVDFDAVFVGLNEEFDDATPLDEIVWHRFAPLIELGDMSNGDVRRVEGRKARWSAGIDASPIGPTPAPFVGAGVVVVLMEDDPALGIDIVRDRSREELARSVEAAIRQELTDLLPPPPGRRGALAVGQAAAAVDFDKIEENATRSALAALASFPSELRDDFLGLAVFLPEADDLEDGPLTLSRRWNHGDPSEEGDWEISVTIERRPGAIGDLACHAYAADRTHHVVFQNEESDLEELWYAEGGEWATNNLTAAASAPKPRRLAPFSTHTWDHDRTQHVVYVDDDGRVHELWFALGTGWRHNDLTRAAGAPSATVRHGVHSYTWAQDTTQHVVYVGTDGHVHELWFAPGEGWRHNDLTRATGGGAPAADSPPFGYEWGHGRSQHVVFADAEGHVHEFQFRGGRWAWTDLTREAGAPAAHATAKLAGYVWERDRSRHVLYRSQEDELVELFSVDGGPWRFNRPAAEAGAGAVLWRGGNPTGYVWKDGAQHVVYPDRDGHVVELLFPPDGGGWRQRDLTRTTGAPEVTTGRPFGYSWPEGKSQHVVFRTRDGMVHELWYEGGWDWNRLLF